MNNYLPGYGGQPVLAQQPLHPETYAAMQAQTAANNAVSSHYESQQRLAKNYRKYADDANIANFRNQLSTLTIFPLLKSLEIAAPMPLELLPVRAQKFVKTAALVLGVSVEMVAACLLGAVFIGARGNFRVKVDENWSEILTGMLLISAPSGERKSAVVDLMRSVFKAFEAELQIDFDQSGRNSDLLVLRQTLKEMERDLAKQVQKKIKAGCSVDEARSQLHTQFAATDRLRASLQKSNAVPRILLDTPTLEALALELERQHEAIGIFEAEGGFWKHRLMPAVDDILLKSFTGESFSSDTKTLGNVYLRSPVLAACSLVQPKVLQAVYDNLELAGHGMTARILPVLLPSRKGGQSDFFTDIPSDFLDWYEALIRRLLTIRRPAPAIGENNRTLHVLGLSSAAKALIRRYGSDINEQIRYGLFERFPAFGAKLAGHAVRLAGAIHLMTHIEPQSEEIDEKSMQAGIALAEFFRIHAKAAFTPQERDGITYAQKIYHNWMWSHRPQIFDERMAQRGVGHCSVAHIRAGLGELERHNYLRTYIANRKALYIVHPRAYEYNF